MSTPELLEEHRRLLFVAIVEDNLPDVAAWIASAQSSLSKNERLDLNFIVGTEGMYKKFSKDKSLRDLIEEHCKDDDHVKYADFSKSTPYLVAVECGREEILNLLDTADNLIGVNLTPKVALFLAVKACRYNLVEIFISRIDDFDVNQRNLKGEPLIIIATETGDLKMLHMILAQKDLKINQKDLTKD